MKVNRRQFLGGVALLGAGLLLDACSADTSGQATTTAGAASSSGPPSSTVASATLPITAQPTTAQPSTTAAAAPWTPGSPAAYVNHGPSSVDVVALTFHFGGAPALATKLLDLLAAEQIRSTLFAIGDWITAHQALGHRAVRDGHELGNHTKSHQSMLKLSAAQVSAEIVGGGEALKPFIGGISHWFRPSGTDVPNQTILAAAGKAGYPVSVGYDVDSRDFTEPGAAQVVKTVNAALHPGAIVSLHFGHQDTIAALPKILGEMNTLGLRPVTVSQILGS